MLQLLKPEYRFTVTQEPDDDYRKYLARRSGTDLITLENRPQAQALDISLDDDEGDVVAGISARTEAGCLQVEMLWVLPNLRRRGIGSRLLQMAEDMALRRGCARARVQVTGEIAFYEKHGYVVTGRLQPFNAHARTIYWLTKPLPLAYEQKGPA